MSELELEFGKGSIFLGEYKGIHLVIKMGRYGPYLQHGQDTHNIKEVLARTSLDSITREDIIVYIENKPFKIDKGVLRVLTPSLSIRLGKYGPYIYYKTAHMKRPSFFALQGFSHSWRTSSIDALKQWIHDTYLSNTSSNDNDIKCV